MLYPIPFNSRSSGQIRTNIPKHFDNYNSVSVVYMKTTRIKSNMSLGQKINDGSILEKIKFIE